MKKHLLLSFLFIALLFSGCTPDDGVDMPEPEQSVEEQILGVWEKAESTANYYDKDGNPLYEGVWWDSHFEFEPPFVDNLFQFTENGLTSSYLNPRDSSITDEGFFNYRILEQDGKRVLEIEKKMYSPDKQSIAITAITDSTMTLQQEFKDVEYCEGDLGPCGHLVPLTVYTYKFRKK